MLNEPSPEKKQSERDTHPLERRPGPTPPSGGGQQQGRVTLRMPVVTPYIVWILIGINALVYVYAQFLLDDAARVDFYRSVWNTHAGVLQNGEYHRLVTAMFMHSLETPFHIVFNMYALYVIGITVERFFGHLRFSIVYFVGGLTGSIMSVVFNGPEAASVGASGAVFAVFGAEMVFLYKHQKLFGEMARIQLRQLAVIAGINLIFGLMSTLTMDGVTIDNWGHIGGFIGGVFVAWHVGPVLIPKRHPTQPDALTIEDINTLEENYQPVLAYISALMIALLVATFLAQRGGI